MQQNYSKHFLFLLPENLANTLSYVHASPNFEGEENVKQPLLPLVCSQKMQQNTLRLYAN